jgi:hypothetical protein
VSDSRGGAHDRKILTADRELHAVVSTLEETSMSTKGTARATYMGTDEPSLAHYYPKWLDNMADDATLEGSLLNGAIQGGEAVRSVVAAIRSLYDRQEHKFAGPIRDHDFLEEYIAQIRGEPIGCVVLVTRNAAGKTQRVVAGYRPLSALNLLSRLLHQKFAGTPLADSFAASER